MTAVVSQLAARSARQSRTVPSLSLIIPAHNEEQRLPATLAAVQAYVERYLPDAEVVVVDNGSRDGTSDVVREAAKGFPGLRLLQTTRAGKGLAVRAGMLEARGVVRIFADADLSWELDDLARIPALVSDRWPVVIGSRSSAGSQRDYPLLRLAMSRTFNGVARWFATPGVSDTQCGFKAFRCDAAREIFGRQRIEGFGFDVEVLFLARHLGFGVREVPIRWVHKANSRVSPVKDSLKMLWDVAAVRLNAATGLYDAASLGDPMSGGATAPALASSPILAGAEAQAA